MFLPSIYLLLFYRLVRYDFVLTTKETQPFYLPKRAIQLPILPLLFRQEPFRQIGPGACGAASLTAHSSERDPDSGPWVAAA